MKSSYMRFLLSAFALMLAFGTNAQFITNNGIPIHNSAVLTTNGDWVSDASTVMTHHGMILTSENFVNDGVLDISSRGGFTLSYESAREFVPGGSHFGSLTKEGGAPLDLSNTINLSEGLYINGGIIRLMNAGDTVGLKAGAELFVEEGAWIEGGFISRAGTGDVLFPFSKDGLYLPLKIYKLNAQKVTASVEDAPVAHTAGPGVDALIDFPYAWRVVKKAETDTAGYVEINYPNSLPVVSNPIVIREHGINEYASMGARLIEDTGTRTIVKSYSRRLRGLFSVGQGFPSDWETDSLALVALYQSTGGPEWVNHTNWLEEPVENWFGVTMFGQSITAVELPANNLKGPVADPLIDILSLQTVNLSANKVTSIPDFTLNPEISSLNVSDNALDFSTLEPNAEVLGINYIIQDEVGVPSESEIPVGTPHTVSIPQQGLSSVYAWRRNGEPVEDADGPDYTIPAISRETMGQYEVEITNPKLPGLTLKSAVQKVMAYANVSGTLLADQVTPAQSGAVTLFRVQPGAFEPVATVGLGDNGTYVFDKVFLDDYQIRGFADTLVHARALPTYYTSTILWEEADTLEIADNMEGLDIRSQLEPAPPTGRGYISGFFEEDDGTGRVDDIEKPKRIERAGVAARRVEHVGRTKDGTVILTLVAYVFTNEFGEFTLPDLPVGEYRLNFQYPGYPMDETSYTTIHIGNGFESHVMVEARVIDGKINVQKATITGIGEENDYHVQAFPNPAVEDIQLKFAGISEGRTVTITDMQGRTVFAAEANDKRTSLNVRSLNNGVYILRVNEKGVTVRTMRIVID